MRSVWPCRDGQSIRAARVIVDIGVQFELEIPKDNPFGSTPARPGACAGAGDPAPALPDGRRVPAVSRSSAPWLRARARAVRPRPAPCGPGPDLTRQRSGGVLSPPAVWLGRIRRARAPGAYG